jgi:hypothetical protein
MQELIESVRAGLVPVNPSALQLPLWVFETVRLLSDSNDFGRN